MDTDAIQPVPLTPTSPKATQGTAKKYIRTLASDMKTVEDGGKPDLAPLIETKPTASEQLVAPSSLPIQSVQPKLAPIPVPSMVLQKPIGAPPIKTYESDFTAHVKETGAAPATIIAAEQDSEQQPIVEVEQVQSKKNFIYIITGFVLVLLGLSGVLFAYIRFVDSPVPILVQGAVAPIFVDEKQEVSGTGNLLLQAISQSVSHNLAPSTVRLIYTASSTMQGNSIFTALPISVPDIVRRNISAEGSMAGIVNTGKSSGYGTGGSQSAFFILSVLAYRDTFAGMLSWERTMPSNLSGLFPAYPAPVISTTTPVATTTSESQTSALGFRDEVVNNHDVRVYRDSQNRSVMLYGYWDQATLVIARDPEVFKEIIGRLATSRLPAQAGARK